MHLCSLIGISYLVVDPRGFRIKFVRTDHFYSLSPAPVTVVLGTQLLLTRWTIRPSVL